MNIGFDAKRAAQNRTGLGNYSRLVLRILSEYFPEEGYHLYIPNEKKTPFIREIPRLSQMQLHYPQGGFWRALRSGWRVWGVTKELRKDRIELFHGLSNELPLNIRKAGCRSIVTIHDLIFHSHPQYYKPIDRWIYDYKFRRACRLSDCVIAVSEYTKQQIIKLYHTPAEKIKVVYQGCDPSFAREIPSEELSAVREKYHLPERYILYIGSIEERKNLLLVVQALVLLGAEECERQQLHVVAVGKRTPYCQEIEQYLRQHRMERFFTMFHDVPFRTLPAFYKLATVFVYPSRIEGFGIPMLEAITSGTPAIGCTGSCLEEAGGPDSVYVHPDDSKAMADNLLRLWNDTEQRQRMIERGKEYAARFTDAALAENLMEVYREVLEREE
jgi:glycosyltransferase involved in cell wall biosynthesis